MAKILIKNAKAVITCDDKDQILRNTDILIDGKQIAEIGKDLRADGARVIDAGRMFVYPGLINTHHHFLQAFTRNIPELQQAALFDWLIFMYELWTLVDPEHVYYSTLIGMSELLKSGCTTAFDHHFCFPQGVDKVLIDRQMEAADAVGIRYHAGRSCFTLTHKDGGLPPDILGETVDEFIGDCERLIEKYHEYDPFGMKRIVVAPCSPFSVTDDTITEAVKLARAKKVMMHSHLAEAPDETVYMREKHNKTSFEWAEELGFLGEDIWYAHAICFSDEEVRKLGAAKAGAAHCPVSNMRTCAGFMKYPLMKETGMRIGLAVDGYGAQDGSNMLGEIRMMYLLHRMNAGSQGPAPGGYECLKTATRGSAAVLGRDDIGSLEAGKAADLFMIDVDHPEFSGAHLDPGAFPAVVGYNRPVDITIVNGEVVWEKGRLKGLDEEAVRVRANEIAARIYASGIYNREAARMRAKNGKRR
jgi:cytosine/adenosine deaminase-related metal-dependent hydrolase